jgi:hypothetical protein
MYCPLSITGYFGVPWPAAKGGLTMIDGDVRRTYTPWESETFTVTVKVPDDTLGRH